MLRYVQMGNMKLPPTVGRFDLPTSVCGQRCPRCYANKMLFPNVVQYRERCLDLAESPDFVEVLDAEIKESGCFLFRLHCSGDFYSQRYVDDWVEIMNRNSELIFFGWTKAFEKFDFSKLPENCNLVDSYTPLGLNYGEPAFVARLVEDYGYFLCPDQGKHTVCMRSCRVCLTVKKVCFLIH